MTDEAKAFAIPAVFSDKVNIAFAKGIARLAFGEGENFRCAVLMTKEDAVNVANAILLMSLEGKENAS